MPNAARDADFIRDWTKQSVDKMGPNTRRFFDAFVMMPPEEQQRTIAFILLTGIGLPELSSK